MKLKQLVQSCLQNLTHGFGVQLPIALGGNQRFANPTHLLAMSIIAINFDPFPQNLVMFQFVLDELGQIFMREPAIHNDRVKDPV